MAISQGSHGELRDSLIDENIEESKMPDRFPWQAEYQGNYIRQQGLSKEQREANIKSLKPEKWLFNE